ncbi:MAG TPA: SRPBCC family protein [Terracidiphilus sp.]|jgi:uncharacterized membrane protein|nr:SRPBCC family protein [Terracidiphilus sp.]
MPEFRFVVDVMAPPQRVWETLVNVERWPEWTSSVTSVQQIEPGPLVLGSRVRIEQPELMTVVWRVTELDERAGLFVWQTGRPGIKVIGSHRVQRAEGGSRVTLTLGYRGLLGWFMALQLKHLNWQYLEMEAHGLKARSEGVR